MTDIDPRACDDRLPRTAVPRRYELHLAPDFAAERFAGTVRITLRVREAVGEFVCHAAGLEVSRARLRSMAAPVAGPAAAEGAPTDATVRLEPERERVRFLLPAAVAPGDYVLEVAYTAAFDRRLKGFFLSRWTDAAGQVQTVASTQFQSTDARRAFPCWDEPDLKAVFAVTLDLPPGCTGVSNGPVRTVTALGDGWRRVAFGDTPRMSTYLVAFVIGPLEATDPVDVDGVALRAVHVPGKGRLARFALDVAAHALRFFASWCDVPYPGSKLDLIAVPERGGAMENLGAAIFVESALLVDAEGAAPAELERVAEVVTHEIAHMWFGDLVTMRWWNGLWLNEAFATFVTLHCLADYRPAWQPWLAFGVQRERAMFIDALPSTRPVEFPVRRPDEAEAMYDVLTYRKGAALLRMLEAYIGPERFRAGVRQYLRAHAFGNTEAEDLWAALGTAADGESVGEMMAPWVLRGGYPLVEAWRDGDGGIRLQQRPFTLLEGSGRAPRGGRAAGADASEQAAAARPGPDRLVPCLCEVRELGGTDVARVRMLLGRTSARLQGGGRGRLPLVNPGGPGFFRVRYRGELRAEMAAAFRRLAPADQFDLLSDTWACALAGLQPLEDLLALVRPLDATVDPSLLVVLEDAVLTLDHAVAADGRDALHAWVRALLAPVLAGLGWDAADGEDIRLGHARSVLIRLLGNTAEDDATIAGARTRLAAGRATRTHPAAGTAAAVLAVVAAHAGPSELEAIWHGYRDARDPQDEQRHLQALAACRTPAAVADVHAACLRGMKAQHAGSVLSQMMADRHSGPATWHFVRSHWDVLLPRFFGKGFWRMLSGAGWLTALEPDGRAPLAEEVRAFLAAQKLGGMRRLADQIVESLEVRVAFARREGARLGPLLAASGR